MNGIWNDASRDARRRRQDCARRCREIHINGPNAHPHPRQRLINYTRCTNQCLVDVPLTAQERMEEEHFEEELERLRANEPRAPLPWDVPNSPPRQQLNIQQAPHIGILTEGVNLELNDRSNAILYDDFNDGDECVRIRNSMGPIVITSGSNTGRYYVYKADPQGLQAWFSQGRNTVPESGGNIHVQQGELERFTYRKPRSNGGKRNRRTKRNTRTRKSKKGRRTSRR